MLIELLGEKIFNPSSLFRNNCYSLRCSWNGHKSHGNYNNNERNQVWLSLYCMTFRGAEICVRRILNSFWLRKQKVYHPLFSFGVFYSTLPHFFALKLIPKITAVLDIDFEPCDMLKQ